jgi:hypothetical protein
VNEYSGIWKTAIFLNIQGGTFVKIVGKHGGYPAVLGLRGYCSNDTDNAG